MTIHLADKGEEKVRALLEAQSPRLSNIPEKMSGSSERSYKAIQRFLKQVDLKQVLLRLYQEEAEFITGDPIEMARYKATKADYVGKLSDGESNGDCLMVLSTPFRGRVVHSGSSPTLQRRSLSWPPRAIRNISIVLQISKHY